MPPPDVNRRSSSHHRTRFGRRAQSDGGANIAVRDIVGLAHIVVGALGLLTGTVGIVFAGHDPAPVVLGLYAAVLVMAVATIFAGVWLRDGRSRGAMLAAAVDGVRLVLVVLAARGINFDVLLAAGLLGAVVWLWPDLEPAR